MGVHFEFGWPPEVPLDARIADLINMCIVLMTFVGLPLFILAALCWWSCQMQTPSLHRRLLAASSTR